jgi:hypothetical protein
MTASWSGGEPFWFNPDLSQELRRFRRELEVHEEQVERITVLIEKLYLEADALKRQGKPVQSRTTLDLADRLTVEMIGARWNRQVKAN